MTTCQKENGCPCRHILRYYLKHIEDVEACGGNPEPCLNYTNDYKFDNKQLYELAHCKCCDRHQNRPLWSDLVKRCPELKFMESPGVSADKSTMQASTLTPEASVK
jgi:hypothetical protein